MKNLRIASKRGLWPIVAAFDSSLKEEEEAAKGFERFRTPGVATVSMGAEPLVLEMRWLRVRSKKSGLGLGKELQNASLSPRYMRQKEDDKIRGMTNSGQ